MGQTTFPLLARDRLGAGAGAVGTLGTFSGAVMVVASLVLASKLPTRAAVTAAAAGAAVLAAALLTVGSAASMVQLVAGMVLIGVAGGLTPPSLVTAIGATAGAQREKLLANYATVLSASLAGGPLLETALLYLVHQDVRIAFFAFAGLPLAAIGLGMRGRLRRRHDPPAPSGWEGRPGEITVDTGDARLVAPPPPQAPASGPSPGGGLRSGLAVLLRTPGGRTALIMQLLYNMPFAAVTVFGALMARSEFGLDAAHGQLGFTTFFATSFLSRVVVARRSPVNAKTAVFVACIALTAAGLLLLAVGGPPADFFAAMALLGVPHGVIFPLALSLVASSSHHDQLGAANAGFFATTNLVTAVTPAILGVIASVSGYRVMSAATLVPVALFAMLLLAQGRARPAPDPGL